MAEIKIQEKQGSSWILWVVGLVILALVIWWVVGRDDRDDDVNVGAATTVPSVVETGPGMGADKFLVAADIIGTVAVAPSFANLGVLALIVAIRTFLSFSLELEISGRWPWQHRPLPGRAQAPEPSSAA